jgi:hypothetical protein
MTPLVDSIIGSVTQAPGLIEMAATSAPFGIQIKGVHETRRSFTQLRNAIDAQTDKTLEEAAEYFVQQAVEYAPEDEHNLKDSIKVLKEKNTLGISQIVAGVDLKHTPATRVKKGGTVEQYALPMEKYARYIDKATMDVEVWLNNKVRQDVQAVQERFFPRLGRRIKEGFGKLLGGIGRLFGR